LGDIYRKWLNFPTAEGGEGLLGNDYGSIQGGHWIKFLFEDLTPDQCSYLKI
jgi:hypothetical protein